MPIVRLENLQQFAAVNLLSDPGAIGGPYVVPSCARIVLQFAVEGGKTAHMVLVGRYAGQFVGSVAQANGILAALGSGGSWTAMAAFLATTTQFTLVTIQNVNSAGQPIISSGAGTSAGSSVSPALPSEVAVCVTKRSGFIGIANRGRMYVPGFATNALGTGNVIAAAAVTAVQNWANTIGTALSAQGYTHVIGQPARTGYTGSTGTVHPSRVANSVDVVSMLVRDNHWDSQRRRGLK